MMSVIVFGFIFNSSRWFELETVIVNATSTSNLNEASQPEKNGSKPQPRVQVVLRNTDLRRNPMYIKYYSLMGSTVVMVLVPVIILTTACISMHKAIPAGNQKQRTLRIMTIIILMFTVCHVPKVSQHLGSKL
jgi:hypothetical protein